MIGLAAEDWSDVRRWISCGAVVVCAHAAVGAAMVHWTDSEDYSMPSSAVVVDFAPMMAAPQQVESEIPPGPEQVMSDASPSRPTDSVEDKPEEKIEQKKIEEELPELPPAPNPEMAVLPQEVQQEAPQRLEPRAPAPATTAPQAIPDQVAAIPVAPTAGPMTPRPSNALPTWKIQVAALLERNKRYPADAQSRREQGVVRLFFSLDRKGNVIASRVATSSGSSALDQEAIALVRRAQPFPAPPPELAGAHVDLTVPIRFNLR
jgi:protein TonB